MSLFMEYLALFAFMAGIVFTFVKRIKYADNAIIPDNAEKITLPAMAFGIVVSISVAVFYVLEGIETNHEINWYLVGGMVVLGGVITTLVIQLISALPAKLWSKFHRK